MKLMNFRDNAKFYPKYYSEHEYTQVEVASMAHKFEFAIRVEVSDLMSGLGEISKALEKGDIAAAKEGVEAMDGYLECLDNYFLYRDEGYGD